MIDVESETRGTVNEMSVGITEKLCRYVPRSRILRKVLIRFQGDTQLFLFCFSSDYLVR